MMECVLKMMNYALKMMNSVSNLRASKAKSKASMATAAAKVNAVYIDESRSTETVEKNIYFSVEILDRVSGR